MHIRSTLRFLPALILFGAAARTAHGQAYTITEPSISACVGALLDSGGEGASGYSDNESYTTTICSDQPGQAITLNWITFDCSTEGPEPIDNLVIYDGPDITAPVIGTYTGTNSPGIVSASFGNTSGCLTLVWTSNSSGTGIFAATILCYTPCEPPTAVATMSEAAPALICQGEAVQFDATGSFAAQGYNIVSYAWDFDDGSTDNSGPTVSHAFAEPGEYIVQITLTDDNECTNTNTIDLPVRVSTTPVFNLGADTSVCIGNPVDLYGDVTPTTWNALPNSDLGGGVFLPDNVGETFTTQLEFNNVFAPGATLNNINLFESLCVNMEHSFMGDIVIQLVCPNGQSVILHQQGGGGTFLGEPVDNDATPDIQGVCYNYCWSPTATNGTWVDNSGNSPLPAGTYESLFPMSALQGCPLNGTWTLNVTDLWGSDNGFICDWGVNFDPSLFPDLTTYTPDLGLSTLDSAFWSGTGIVTDPNDPQTGTITPTSPGSNTYIFSVTDNFGCTYTDEVVVSASGPLAQASVLPPSPQPLGVTAQFTDESVGNGTNIVAWDWDFGNGLPNSNLEDPLITFNEPGEYLITLTVTGADGCSSSTQLSYIVAPADVVIPNVFSPNGDGYNDALEFSNAQYFPGNQLRVYNRWGQNIFESFNYRNTWTASGVPDGTYYFVFAMQDGRKWAGHVTLLR